MFPSILVVITWILSTGIVVSQSQLKESIYHHIPEHVISHCTRKLNATHQIGCSSRAGGSFGQVLFVQNASSVVNFLTSSGTNVPSILLMDSNLFINATLMRVVRLEAPQNGVVGILVFAPSDNDSSSLGFSESNTCPNGFYSYYGPEKQCNVSPPWNPTGTDYSNIEWPFPVALIHASDPKIKSPTIYCDEMTGVNIVLGATNKTVALTTRSITLNETAQPWHLRLPERAANSSLLILTRMDSRSMFERSGFGSQNILPSVSVLVAAAAHLMRQPAFKKSHLARDLFFVFLDNEAYDFLGSGILNYDLREQRLARYTGHPVSWDHIYGMIELGELGLPRNMEASPAYYMLTDSEMYNKTKQVTDELMDQISTANQRSGKLSVTRSQMASDTPLPPTASLQGLLSLAPRTIPHVLLTDHDGPPLRNGHFGSYLDTTWPPIEMPKADETLLTLANVLADALHRLATPDASPIPEEIVDSTPGELMHCFVVNPNCTLLREFLSPNDVKFLLKLGTPIPAQSYMPLQKHELKVSHIVNVLLMGLTGERTASAQCPTDATLLQDSYVYLMGYFNGYEQCYRTFLDLAYKFVLFRGDVPVAPAWMRSRLVSDESYVRWYRSSSTFVDGFTLALGLLMVTVTGLCVFFLRNTVNKHLIAPATTIPVVGYSNDLDVGPFPVAT